MSLPVNMDYKPLDRKHFNLSDEVFFVIDGECSEIENEKKVDSFNLFNLFNILRMLFEPIFKGFFSCFKTSLLIPIYFYNKPSAIKYAFIFLSVSSLGGIQVFGTA